MKERTEGLHGNVMGTIEWTMLWIGKDSLGTIVVKATQVEATL